MPRFTAICCLLLATSLLAGCPQAGNLRLAQDRPEDIPALLEQDEYGRVRQVLKAHPQAATDELRVDITTRESLFENRSFEQARALEAGGDLVGATGILSDALGKVPDSTLLGEYSAQLARVRADRLLENERRQDVARARYLIDEKALLEEQTSLQPPTFSQRWKSSSNRNEAEKLSGTLLQHGRLAMDNGDLASARECLELSQALRETEAARSLMAELSTIENRQQRVAIQEQATKKKKQKISRKQAAISLVSKARDELDRGDVEAARDIWNRVAVSERTSGEATAFRTDLEKAIVAKVESQILKGDALYRADKISMAILAWSEADRLDPDNPEVTERIERANKVLARLEELKNRQKK